MVKCPRGSPSQAKANLQHFNQSTTLPSGSEFSLWTQDLKRERESKTPVPESENSELSSARAEKRCPLTARDELVYFFVGYFFDILIESWESKPRKKLKLNPQPLVSNESEYFGEDLGPCDDSVVSFTTDSPKDLSQKRPSSKENSKFDSESTDSEYLNEVDGEKLGWTDPLHAFVLDEDVYFVLFNGVWYRGKVSKKLMEGDGTYFWEDGSSYQGDFVEGCVTGKGRLEFSNMTVYEGGVHKAFRHGEGMCCFLDSPVTYSGQWWLGKKHGHGLIVYNDPSEGDNFYRGQWQDGYKEGFGFRQYPSGSKYIGFWSNGKRHGKGVMLWNNHDIYRGEWKEGLMHGYGEYTWNGFANKTLSYPATNTYRGFWSEGRRNGRGVFECKNGALIETFWVENEKSGGGTVICCNGAVVASTNLFQKDKQACFIDQEDKIGLMVRDAARFRHQFEKTDVNEEHLMVHLESAEKSKAISIPILSPPKTLNLDSHIRKYCIQKKSELKSKEPKARSNFDVLSLESETDEVFGDKFLAINSTSLDSENLELFESQSPSQCQLSECGIQEERQLRNYIITKASALKACYNHYATLACDKQPSFQCVLLRMFLWQMLVDARVPNSELSLVDIDVMTAKEERLLLINPHDPFERIHFWQFLHILVMLSWHLYGQYVLGEGPLVENERINDFLEYFENAESKMVFKTALEYFLKNNIFQGRFDRNYPSFFSRDARFEESDFAPMEAMYLIYCNVGVPHSARDFLNAVCSKTDENIPGIVRYFERLPFYKMDGRNALTVAGELHHVPGPELFNHPEVFELETSSFDPNAKTELTCFNGLKASGVLKCLIQVCPGIVNEDVLVNMDYKLTFLEFYKVVILCTEHQLKLKVMEEIRTDLIKEYKIKLEEYEKKMLEREKRKDVITDSRKKSRQLIDPPKKARKNVGNE